MARTFLPTLAAACVLAMSATAASAQPASCGPRAEMVEWLREVFDERPMGFGLIGNHTVLEIHVSETTGTWTALTTSVSGQTCMVSAGHSWTPVEQPADHRGTKDASGP